MNSFKPTFILPKSMLDYEKATKALEEYIEKNSFISKRLTDWNPDEPYPVHRALSGFLFW